MADHLTLFWSFLKGYYSPLKWFKVCTINFTFRGMFSNQSIWQPNHLAYLAPHWEAIISNWHLHRGSAGAIVMRSVVCQVCLASFTLPYSNAHPKHKIMTWKDNCKIYKSYISINEGSGIPFFSLAVEVLFIAGHITNDPRWTEWLNSM